MYRLKYLKSPGFVVPIGIWGGMLLWIVGTGTKADVYCFLRIAIGLPLAMVIVMPFIAIFYLLIFGFVFGALGWLD